MDQMFRQNFEKSFMGNWNGKMEPGNDSFGRVFGYPAQHSHVTSNLFSIKFFVSRVESKVNCFQG